MDPHGQHEPEDNDLADFFDNFSQWWNAYGNYVLLVLVIVAAGLFAWSFITNRARAQHESAWTDLAFNSSPQGFSEVAQSHSDPTVQALAYLRAGDLLLGQAISPPKPKEADQGEAAKEKGGSPPPTKGGTNKQSAKNHATGKETHHDKGKGKQKGGGPSKPDHTAAEAPKQAASNSQEASQEATKASPDRATALRQAKQAYQQALDVTDQPILRLNALLGLGAVAESQQDWATAKSRYHQVIDLAGDTYLAVRDQAHKRLSLLSEMKQTVKFAPPTPSSPASSPSASPPSAATPSPPPPPSPPLQTGTTTGQASPSNPPAANAKQSAPPSGTSSPPSPAQDSTAPSKPEPETTLPEHPASSKGDSASQ